MDLFQQVGQSYLERKAYAAPQQLENVAKKQFQKGASNSKGAASAAGEEEEERGEGKSFARSTKGRGTTSEKDIEIARLRGQLEESRRGGIGGRGKGGRGGRGEDDGQAGATKRIAHPTEKAARTSAARKPPALEGAGLKLTNNALVTEAASRSHREKRPQHGASKGVGKTIDGKGIGVAGGALVAEGGGRGREIASKGRTRAEPEIVEAAPRRWGSFGAGGSAAQSVGSRRASGGGEIMSGASRQRRLVFAGESETGDTAPSPSPRRKSILASRARRPSTESDVGSVIAPRAQIESIRRRQRSRGRGIADAEIDTPAPETPSLRKLSGRRRSMDLRHERRGGSDEEDGVAHLPERRKSIRRERVGEGRVLDVMEVRSVPFRPGREGGAAGEREKGREVAVVEVMEEDVERRRAPTARKVQMGGRNGGQGEGTGLVEVVRSEGGRTVYRVR